MQRGAMQIPTKPASNRDYPSSPDFIAMMHEAEGGGGLCTSDNSNPTSPRPLILSTSEDSHTIHTHMAFRKLREIDLNQSQEVYFPPLRGRRESSPSSLQFDAKQGNDGHSPSEDMSWVIGKFEEQLRSDPDVAVAVAAVTVLTEVIKVSNATTMYEVQLELKEAASQLQKCSSSISLSSGCALFTNFVTRTVENIESSRTMKDFETCKKRLIERGESFRSKAMLSRTKIGATADRFIHDGLVVLTNGFSRVVLAVLMRAHSCNKRFRVVVAESRPDSVGYMTARTLHEAGVPVTLTTDNAVAHIMDTVDLVLVGAEAVVENGGIVSRIGTYGLSIVAKELKKPFYVAAESFKFTRIYPLNQRDIPSSKKRQKALAPPPDHYELPEAIEVDNPPVDYTPPEYITLLFTDLGVLTPSAISDELIKLYY